MTRWGILGTGKIARQFVEGLRVLPDAAVVAVGSRTQAAADDFGEAFGIARRYASYEALVADPDVDAVYVSTPHPMHADNSLLALRAGKAVLCEKPFAMNEPEAAGVVAEARARGVFLMEAMWTRFMPAIHKVRALVADGAIGEPRLLQADFGFRADFDPHSRLFDPVLGGGALLDVGVYCVTTAHMIFGAPERVTGLADLGATGVDEQSALVLSYPGGQLAVLHAAVRTSTPQEVLLCGTSGRIRYGPINRPTALTLWRGGREPEVIATPYDGNAYHYQAAEVARCLSQGRTESDVMPLDETLAVMRTLDTARRQWGLTYPGE
jgi:predicted dehydrogenase